MPTWRLVAGLHLCALVGRCLPASVNNSLLDKPETQIVIGYSIGHVGTSTLSNAETFAGGRKPFQDFVFRFELNGAGGQRPPRPRGTRRVRGLTLADEYDTHRGSPSFQRARVRDAYRPYIARQLARNRDPGQERTTYVDLSHQSIFLMEGYVREFAPQLRLVRIRRTRLESALSWCRPHHLCYSNRWSETKRMTRLNGFYNYAPVLAYPVEIPLVLSTLWGNMTASQRAMWYMDEVEARWQGLVSGPACAERAEDTRAPRCLEVTWSKYQQDPAATERAAAGAGSCPVPVTNFASAVVAVAEFLGLSPRRAQPVDQKHHSHTPAKVGATAMEALPQLVEMHRQYMGFMDFNDSTKLLIGAQLACL